MAATENEREMLREGDEARFGERRPWESSRQATYEDTAPEDHGWDADEDRSG